MGTEAKIGEEISNKVLKLIIAGYKQLEVLDLIKEEFNVTMSKKMVYNIIYGFAKSQYTSAVDRRHAQEVTQASLRGADRVPRKKRGA